jgi:hypothetical protein
MSFQSKILNRLKKLEDNKVYSVDEIVAMQVILNTKLVSTRNKVYRVITRKELPAVNLGGAGQARWFVQGRDLKKYVESRFVNSVS